MERQANYISLFLLVTLFILEANAEDHIRILSALLLSYTAATVAFIANWLTLDGRFSAVVVGTLVLGLGGWTPALLLLIFFLSSTLFTTLRTEAKAGTESALHHSSRRDGAQVWANSFWILLPCFFWFITEDGELLLLAAAAIAAVTADTWATELGNRIGVTTIRITDLQPVRPGTDGGISMRGVIAGLAGAMLIAFAYMALTAEFALLPFSVILVSGFSGCMADSYLGALLRQRRLQRYRRLIRLSRTPEQINNATNWLAAATGVLTAFILIQLF